MTRVEKSHKEGRCKAFSVIPLDECLRLAKEEYDPEVNYAEVLASVIEQATGGWQSPAI